VTILRRWTVWLSPLLAWIASACTQVVREEDLFHPEQYRPLESDQYRRAVEIPAADGAILRGWFIHAPENRRTVVYFYGNAQTTRAAEGSTYWLSRSLGCNVLTVDYRGYGASDGEPAFQPMLEDALTLYDALGDLLPEPQPIVVYGRSIGSVFATYLASERPVAGLILACPPASAEDAVVATQSRVPIPLRWFLKLRADDTLTEREIQPVVVIRGVTAPLLVIHGDQDETIPFEHGQRIHAAAGSTDKVWLPLPGKGHSDWDVFDAPITQTLRSFLDMHAAG
jgi:pimeloyl-ACP methyl ester carboxylesterase